MGNIFAEAVFSKVDTDNNFCQNPFSKKVDMIRCPAWSLLARDSGTARLENACECLLAFTSTPSIRTLSTILKNEQDKAVAPKEPEASRADAQHGITHGVAYFHRGGGSK